MLLVDDVEANLVALEALLDGMELRPRRARSSGNEALRHLLKREFAVMLLDVQMPEMDGYEVARMRARQPRDPTTCPIIFLTAMHETEENVLRGYGSGAVDFLFKPINPSILRSKVRVFLELYSLAPAAGRGTPGARATQHRSSLAGLGRSRDGRTVSRGQRRSSALPGEDLDPEHLGVGFAAVAA